MNANYLRNREDWLTFQCAVLKEGINPDDIGKEPKTYSWTNPLNFGVCVNQSHRLKGFGKLLYQSIMKNADGPVVVDGNSSILRKWGLTPLKLVV